MSNELVLVPKDMIQKALGMALKFGFVRGKKKESEKIEKFSMPKVMRFVKCEYKQQN